MADTSAPKGPIRLSSDGRFMVKGTGKAMTNPEPPPVSDRARKAAELKSCPFCGGDATFTKGYWKAAGWHPPKIMCANKHVFRNFDLFKDDGDGEANRRIVEDWNARFERDLTHGDSALVERTLNEAADYLDGYAGGHYMAKSCAAVLRERARSAPIDRPELPTVG